MTEEEMDKCHHQLNGHGFGCNPRVGDGQGGLVCCGSWCCKESDTTKTELTSSQAFSGDQSICLPICLCLSEFKCINYLFLS